MGTLPASRLATMLWGLPYNLTETREKDTKMLNIAKSMVTPTISEKLVKIILDEEMQWHLEAKIEKKLKKR